MSGKKIVSLASVVSICMTALAQEKPGGLTVGGYGEAVWSANFYSNNPYRYMYPERYANAQGYSTVDLPHVVIMLSNDFGDGWSMNTEIEFEHGGLEASIEVEGDEAIEIEHEIERGGEVYLEQFWLQKSFSKAANLRAGMIIVPIGQLNTRHEPDKFFTVLRPEGESTILPCTWHQIGISFWGRNEKFRYEAQLLTGLNSRFFNNSNWIQKGASSPYEYTMANKPAIALRADCFLLQGKLRIGSSAYAGGTANDAYPASISKDGKTNGTTPDGLVAILTADLQYNGTHFVARANSDYGYLHNASAIGSSNKNSDNSTFSPYQHTLVGRNAWTAGGEAGLNLFSLRDDAASPDKLFLFSRYDYYDSYVPDPGQADYKWAEKHRVAVGANYFTGKGIILKAELYCRLFGKNCNYNSEPGINIGIAYTGLFK